MLLVADVASHFVVADEATKAAENLRDATIAKIENILQRVEMSVVSSSWLIRENLNDEEYLYHITRKMVEENPDIIGSAIAFDRYYFKDKLFFSPLLHRCGKRRGQIEATGHESVRLLLYGLVPDTLSAWGTVLGRALFR